MPKIDVPMPQMGESIAEGTVSKWLKGIGDTVERDEPILEISTDKVDAEIPAPAAGTLVEVAVQEGETVDVGAVIAVLETEVEAGADAAPTKAVPAPDADTPDVGTPDVGTPGNAGVGPVPVLSRCSSRGFSDPFDAPFRAFFGITPTCAGDSSQVRLSPGGAPSTRNQRSAKRGLRRFWCTWDLVQAKGCAVLL